MKANACSPGSPVSSAPSERMLTFRVLLTSEQGTMNLNKTQFQHYIYHYTQLAVKLFSIPVTICVKTRTDVFPRAIIKKCPLTL